MLASYKLPCLIGALVDSMPSKKHKQQQTSMFVTPLPQGSIVVEFFQHDTNSNGLVILRKPRKKRETEKQKQLRIMTEYLCSQMQEYLAKPGEQQEERQVVIVPPHRTRITIQELLNTKQQ